MDLNQQVVFLIGVILWVLPKSANSNIVGSSMLVAKFKLRVRVTKSWNFCNPLQLGQNSIKERFVLSGMEARPFVSSFRFYEPFLMKETCFRAERKTLGSNAQFWLPIACSRFQFHGPPTCWMLPSWMEKWNGSSIGALLRAFISSSSSLLKRLSSLAMLSFGEPREALSYSLCQLCTIE